MGLHPFYRHVYHFNFLKVVEYLHDVNLGHIPGEHTKVYFGGFRGRSPPLLYFSFLLGDLDLELVRCLLLCLHREGLGEPEEMLELEFLDVLELSDWLDADEEVEPLLEPVVVLEPKLEVELDRDLVLLLPMEVLLF